MSRCCLIANTKRLWGGLGPKRFDMKCHYRIIYIYSAPSTSMVFSIQSYLVLSLSNLNIEDFLVASSHYCRRHFSCDHKTLLHGVTGLHYQEIQVFKPNIYTTMFILNIIVNFTRYKCHRDSLLILQFSHHRNKVEMPTVVH